MYPEGKQRIIEAAQRLIAEQGVEKTSMRAIAEEASITTGAIYYYYKSKEELLYDVMDYTMSITSSVMALRDKGTATRVQLLDEIRQQIAQRLTSKNAHSSQFYLAYQAALGNEELRQKFAQSYAEQTLRTKELFNHVFETPPQPEDAYLAVLMIASLDGINLQQFVGALPVDSAALAAIYNEFFSYAVPGFLRQLNEKRAAQPDAPKA